MGQLDASIALRLLRGKAVWSAAWIAFGVAGAVSLAFTALSITRLPTPAVNEVLFGGTDGRVDIRDIWVYDDLTVVEPYLDELATQGAEVIEVALSSRVTMPLSHDADVVVREISAEFAQDSGIELTSGRWPQRPGEAVATIGLDLAEGALKLGTIPGELTIVGVIEDTNDLRARVLIVAPGTWASWDWADREERYPFSGASVTVYIMNPSGAPLWVEGAEVVTAAQHGSLPRPSVIDVNPLYITYPAILLGLVAGMGAAGFQSARMRSSRNRLVSLGMTTPRANGVVGFSVAVPAVIMTLVGAVIGWGVGIALTPAWLTLGGHRHSTVPTLGPVVAALVVAVAVGSVASTAIGFSRESRGSAQGAPDRAEARKVPRGFAYIASVAGIVGLVYLVTVRDRSTASYALTLVAVAVGAVAPFVFSLRCGDNQGRSMAAVIGRRRLLESPFSAATLVFFACFTMGPLMLNVIGTATAEREYIDSGTLPPVEGQVQFYQLPSAIEPEVMDVMARVTGGSAQVVRVSYPLDSQGRYVVVLNSSNGMVTVVDSVTDYSLLTGDSTSGSAEVLNAGGILLTAPLPESTQTLVSLDDETGAPAVEVGVLPSATASLEGIAWRNGTPGFLLTTTAQRLGLTTVPSDIYVVDVSLEQADHARRLLAADGIDPSIVRTPRDFSLTSFIEPRQLVVPIVSFLTVLLGVCAAIVAHGRTLAARNAGLRAIGAPRPFTVAVLAWQVGICLAAGLVAGLALGLTVNALFAGNFGVPVAVPWATVAALLVAVVTVAAVATVAVGARASATGRLSE